MEQLYFEPTLRVLICKVHGYGVHPSHSAITRHLRGEGHWFRGAKLKETVAQLLKLPLNSTEELLAVHTSLSGQPPLPAVMHLQIQKGFQCRRRGCIFLTTSLELIQRHVRKCIEEEIWPIMGELWQVCPLQTIFQETKFRRYFVVSDAGPGTDHRSRSLSDSATLLDRPSRKSSQPERLKPVHTGSLVPISSPASIPTLMMLHPIATMASRHVDYMTPWSLDRLFKSDAFRSTSDPLFDPRHVDAVCGMVAVFPGCDREPLFFHALIYSILQFDRQTADVTRATISAEANAIQLLHKKLCEPAATLSRPVIGAVALLKTTAYKLNDRECYAIHAKGLDSLLEACPRSPLTYRLRRALFWEDLYATVFLSGNLRRATWTLPSSHVVWHDDVYRIPFGFQRYQEELPPDLLKCVKNTIELQDFHDNALLPSRDSRDGVLDKMQASIESRLVDLRARCMELGVHIEIIRQAVFLCCYGSWMEVWDDSFMLFRIGSSILDLLEASLLEGENCAVREENTTILTWALLIASSVVDKDQHRNRSYSQQRKQVFSLANTLLKGICSDARKSAINSALHDFLYFRKFTAFGKNKASWFTFEAMEAATATA